MLLIEAVKAGKDEDCCHAKCLLPLSHALILSQVDDRAIAYYRSP
jgi:hypothetical protein